MIDFANMTLEELIRKGGYDCACGRHHEAGLTYLKIGRDAVAYIPEGLSAIGVKRPFVVCDRNTRAAAWEPVRAQLEAAGIRVISSANTCRDADLPSMPAEVNVLMDNPELWGVLDIGGDPSGARVL